MDRDILNKLYIGNKKDTILKDKILNRIEELEELLHSCNSNAMSDILYDMLCEYFCVSDNIDLQDLISEATSSANYTTLEELENKINEIRKGE